MAIQCYTSGWMVANSISGDFQQLVPSVNNINAYLTSFENEISIGEAVRPRNYKHLVHNLSQVIDINIPTMVTRNQKYILTASQSLLRLTDVELRRLISEYQTCELMWLQWINPRFISPNLLNNRQIVEIDMVPSLSCGLTTRAMQVRCSSSATSYINLLP